MLTEEAKKIDLFIKFMILTCQQHSEERKNAIQSVLLVVGKILIKTLDQYYFAEQKAKQFPLLS